MRHCGTRIVYWGANSRELGRVWISHVSEIPALVAQRPDGCVSITKAHGRSNKEIWREGQPDPDHVPLTPDQREVYQSLMRMVHIPKWRL